MFLFSFCRTRRNSPRAVVGSYVPRPDLMIIFLPNAPATSHPHPSIHPSIHRASVKYHIISVGKNKLRHGKGCPLSPIPLPSLPPPSNYIIIPSHFLSSLSLARHFSFFLFLFLFFSFLPHTCFFFRTHFFSVSFGEFP